MEGNKKMPKVLTLLAPGFEEIEAITVIDLLRRADIDVTVAGLEKEVITGSHAITVKTDSYHREIDPVAYDALFLPGGQPGTNNLKKDPLVLQWVNDFYSSGRLVTAICAAPTVLLDAGIVTGKRVTSYPSEKDTFTQSTYLEEPVVEDGTIITSRGVGTAIPFALRLVARLKDQATADILAERILFST
jgi:4-methyl-5(b-hydroxyethyl)-thiazole monophosphate biosynthesis